MCSGGTVNTLVEGGSRWSYQAGGKEEINGCGERVYEDSRRDRRRWRGQGKMADEDQKKFGNAERRKKNLYKTMDGCQTIAFSGTNQDRATGVVC